MLKSIAHNISHSFVSFTNYVDDGYVIDALRRLVRTVEGNRISIDWIPGIEQHPELTPRILESIKWYKPELMRLVHNMGAISEFDQRVQNRNLSKKNKQIAVEGVLVDDRGRVYETPIHDF